MGARDSGDYGDSGVFVDLNPLFALTRPYLPPPYFKFSFSSTAKRYAARATQLICNGSWACTVAWRKWLSFFCNNS